MKPTKKEIAEAKKAAEKSSKEKAGAKKDECECCKCEVFPVHIDEIWNVIDELQKNLDTLNDRVARVMDRMGLE